MFNIPLYESDKIKAATNESQTHVILQFKANDDYRVLKGEDATRFRTHAFVGNFVKQRQAELEAQKAQLDAEAQSQITAALSESELYFNGLTV